MTLLQVLALEVEYEAELLGKKKKKFLRDKPQPEWTFPFKSHLHLPSIFQKTNCWEYRTSNILFTASETARQPCIDLLKTFKINIFLTIVISENFISWQIIFQVLAFLVKAQALN